MMFWGLHDFKDVVCPAQYDVLRIYDQEKYNLNYKNFSGSIDYSFGFSVNWINRKRVMVSQRFSYFKGSWNDGLELTLTDIGDGSLAYYPMTEFSSANVGIGSVACLNYRSEISGFSTSLVFYLPSAVKSIQIGAGINFNMFGSDDTWWRGKEMAIIEGYRPAYLERGSSYYGTQQLGLSVNAIWSWKFIQVYLNLGNSFLTTKKDENKGQWYGDFNFFPTSHNYDYRFPLTFETGIALSFDRIKKSVK